MQYQLSTSYPVAERFISFQGEGLFAGTPMAFVRMVGCSVGKHVCAACDTQYAKVRKEDGGGMYTSEEIVEWAVKEQQTRLCITGGEPLDRDLSELFHAAFKRGLIVHVETSGTKCPPWFHQIMLWTQRVWLTVSPKPRYLDSMIGLANEIKVIVGGLGDGDGWPTIEDAVRWSAFHLVYVQPRNYENTLDPYELRRVTHLLTQHPTLRLSVQLHKVVGVR